MTYDIVLYIYLFILSVELVHAVHSCSSFIHSETVVASTFVQYAACTLIYTDPAVGYKINRCFGEGLQCRPVHRNTLSEGKIVNHVVI